MSMGTVHQLHENTEELSEFFTFIFGEEQKGYVYSATKHPTTDVFEQYFFQWPSEKDELIVHTQRMSVSHEVYYSPSLFSRPESTKEAFLGTYFLWTEFDGITPSDMQGIPQPTFKLQSSEETHQHWYWKLEHFINDKTAVEEVAQRLTYFLQADLSGWDCNQLLRPPGTVHHESSKITSVLRWDTRPVGLEEFAALPDLPVKLLHGNDIGAIPSYLDVIFKYAWTTENFTFFREKEIKSGKESGTGKGRSSALTKLGHICMEMGMSNAEALSILLHADNRWKKFSRRTNQKQCLIGIINHCRLKTPINPVEEEIKSPLQVFTFEEFINTKIEIEWVVKDFIHRKGLVVTFGKAAVGKSQFWLRFSEAMAKGGKFLKWQVEKPMKILYISMEMPHEELKHFLDIMKMERGELINKNLLLMPLGRSIKLNHKVAQEHLKRVFDEFQPDGVVFDSFGKAVGEDLDKPKIVFDVVDYIESLRDEFGCWNAFIHHPRKAQPGNKKPTGLDDMYGSTYFGNNATNVFVMWPNRNYIDIECRKLRMAKDFEPFKVQRTPDLNFKVVSGTSSRNDRPAFETEDEIDLRGVVDL